MKNVCFFYVHVQSVGRRQRRIWSLSLFSFLFVLWLLVAGLWRPHHSHDYIIYRRDLAGGRSGGDGDGGWGTKAAGRNIYIYLKSRTHENTRTSTQERKKTRTIGARIKPQAKANGRQRQTGGGGGGANGEEGWFFVVVVGWAKGRPVRGLLKACELCAKDERQRRESSECRGSFFVGSCSIPRDDGGNGLGIVCSIVCSFRSVHSCAILARILCSFGCSWARGRDIWHFAHLPSPPDVSYPLLPCTAALRWRQT